MFLQVLGPPLGDYLALDPNFPEEVHALIGWLVGGGP